MNPDTPWIGEFGMGWIREEKLGILGPPIKTPCDPTDARELQSHKSKMDPCPLFPKDFTYESYKQWRLQFMQWVWEQRRIGICESLFGAAFRKACKNAGGGIPESLDMMDPRIMGWPGRPAGQLGPDDPGELSGAIWYVKKMDARFWREDYEDGYDANAAFEKVKQNGTMIDYVMEFDKAYTQARIRSGLFMDQASLTRAFLNRSRLGRHEKMTLMERVDGDPTKFNEIQWTARRLYPFDKTLHVSGAQEIHWADEGEDDQRNDQAPAMSSYTPPGGYQRNDDH